MKRIELQGLNTERLNALAEVRCLPFHVASDASGSLSKGAVLRLQSPSKVFTRLPDGARKAMREYLYEAPPELAKIVLDKVAVRPEPELADWESCLGHLGRSAAENGGVLLPNQKPPARYSLDKILRTLNDDCENPLPALYLFDEEDKLLEVEKLVWMDAPKLKNRCTKLGLGFAEFDSAVVSGEMLCRKSGCGAFRRSSGKSSSMTLQRTHPIVRNEHWKCC